MVDNSALIVAIVPSSVVGTGGLDLRDPALIGKASEGGFGRGLSPPPIKAIILP